MDDIDVGLFDRDWNNTLYFFILNSDERIYMRYGGRDSKSQDTYLNLQSLELALQKGLELHRSHARGEALPSERPKSLYPRQIPLLVERTMAQNRCVECHLIGDFMNLQRERDGTLDKPAHLYRSPDIRTLGIELDIPRGLRVKEVAGAAEAAGMKPGDVLMELEGTPVWTFADFQYFYDRVPRSAAKVGIAVERGGTRLPLSVALPARWWWTDVTFRQSSVEPRVYFDSRPLTRAEKLKLGLDADGFASEVTRVDMFAEVVKSHELRVGDVIAGVDGVTRDDFADTAELFVKLRKTAGDTVTLDVIRGGRRLVTKLKTYRMGFRK